MARRTLYRRYSAEFKATAVKLSQVDGVQSKDVAEALDIHPLMLSRWRTQMRRGEITARGQKIETKQVAELKRLRKLEKNHQLLKQEHSLLKKAIQFSLERKKSSLSS